RGDHGLRLVSAGAGEAHDLVRQRPRGPGASGRDGAGARARERRRGVTAVVLAYHPRREARRAVKSGYPREAGSVCLCRSLQALADAPKLLRLTDRLQLAAWDEVLRRVGVPTQTAHLAQALRVTREHLSREFAAGGAPNLKRVIDLARTACAADLLGNPGYSVRQVVRILGYASPSHLAGAARRVAGATPQELREVGARGVLARFLKGRTRSRI